ncbi:hypothetical protein NHJ13734_005005 [Beauveria thailandica]
MPSTHSSSTTDGAQEPPELPDSHNSSRQPSYHQTDASTLSYMWPQSHLPLAFASQGVQSLEGIQSTLSASMPYYEPYPRPVFPADLVDPFAICQQAGSWSNYPSDTASAEPYYELHAPIQRTDSTVSVEAAKRNSRAPGPVDCRSKTPWKGDSDRASRGRSIVGAVAPPTDAGVKKLRKHLHGSSSRRSSIALASSAANVLSPPDVNGRRHSAPKEEVMSNDEVLSSEDEDSRHRPKSAGNEPTFACPFYRRWPTRHIECMSRKLTRIQDVKQHIYRRHSKPPFYCPTCAQTFASPDPRDNHIRQKFCTPATASAERSSDGISAEVHDSLKNRFHRRLSPVEQWYGIWDLIFQREARPQNVHVGSMVTEMLGMLKDFWKNEGQHIIPTIVKPGTTQLLTDADLHLWMTNMLDKVKDHFEGEIGMAGGTATDGGTWSQADQTMDNSPVDGEFGAPAEDEEVSYEPSPPVWDATYCSPIGSPPIAMDRQVVESSADLGSSGTLVGKHSLQSWLSHSMANAPVNRFQ